MVMAAPGFSRPRGEEVRSNAEAALPPPFEVPDETVLIDALRAGDEAAFRALMDRHESAMLRLAYGHVGSHALAQDVVQETWLGVIRGIHTFRRQSSLKTWIFRILLNRARTWGRREARSLPFSQLSRLRSEPDDGAGISDRIPANRISETFTSTGRSPLMRALDSELRERLDAAIDLLPERQRQILLLRDIEGWGSEDVCNVMGISETNQRVLLHRARSRIRRELAAYVDDQPREGDEHTTRLR
jgi:RNA polymerase sigma-70 factor (ECF subfamily)